MTKENKEKIFIGLFLIVISLLGMLLVLWYNNKYIKNDISATSTGITIATSTNNIASDLNIEEIKPTGDILSNSVDDTKKYDSYKKFTVYPNGMETPNDYLQNSERALTRAGRKISFSGDIEDAYIYIKAGATNDNGDFTAIMNDFDGIWFYLMNGEFNGGQLDLSKSIYGKPTNLSEILYHIKSVPVATNLSQYRQNKFSSLDLSNHLQGDKYIGALVSTARHGKIMELTIGYKCKTGSSCDIK